MPKILLARLITFKFGAITENEGKIDYAETSFLLVKPVQENLYDIWDNKGEDYPCKTHILTPNHPIFSNIRCFLGGRKIS
jgi:hypothetical protein